MISCINLFRKNPSISQEDFVSFLKKEYADYVLVVPNIYEYEQNYVTLKEAGDASSEAIVADAFTIERYETLNDYKIAAASPEYKRLLEKRVEVVDYNETYICLENVSIPKSNHENARKKISLLGRKAPKVSFEDFTREWFVVHSGCMAKMPKDIFYGYNQHLIIDRMINGQPVSHTRLPFDGILELFFSEAPAVANAFATIPEGQATVAHRKDFMTSVDPFQVDFKVFKCLRNANDLCLNEAE